jgi:hypothetical protein
MTFRWVIFFAGLLVVLGLPLAGKWARSTPEKCCALDGVEINRLYRVRIVDDQEREREFCCIRCASLWLRKQRSKPQSIFVTDEATGKEVNAAFAWFVWSLVVTVAHTENRIHAFRNHAEAVKHAETARGKVLVGAEKPFFGATGEN